MVEYEIQWCSQKAAKSNGEFICSRESKDQMIAVYVRLMKKLKKGAIKVVWIPRQGYCVYYFDKKEVSK